MQYLNELHSSPSQASDVGILLPPKLKLAIFMCWCPLVRIFRSRGSYGPVTPAGSSVNTQSFASHWRERQFPAPTAPPAHLPPQSVERDEPRCRRREAPPDLPHCGRAWRGAPPHFPPKQPGGRWRAGGGVRSTNCSTSSHQAHQAVSISYTTDTRTPSERDTLRAGAPHWSGAVWRFRAVVGGGSGGKWWWESVYQQVRSGLPAY